MLSNLGFIILARISMPLLHLWVFFPPGDNSFLSPSIDRKECVSVLRIGDLMLTG